MSGTGKGQQLATHSFKPEVMKFMFGNIVLFQLFISTFTFSSLNKIIQSEIFSEHEKEFHFFPQHNLYRPFAFFFLLNACGNEKVGLKR